MKLIEQLLDDLCDFAPLRLCVSSCLLQLFSLIRNYINEILYLGWIAESG